MGQRMPWELRKWLGHRYPPPLQQPTSQADRRRNHARARATSAVNSRVIAVFALSVLASPAGAIYDAIAGGIGLLMTSVVAWRTKRRRDHSPFPPSQGMLPGLCRTSPWPYFRLAALQAL